jgi:hypothetical protein
VCGRSHVWSLRLRGRIAHVPLTATSPDPHVLVLVGARGDLARRKLMPGLEKPLAPTSSPPEASTRRCTSISTGGDFPDRSLPGQRVGAGHPRAALRQRPVRADLEPPASVIDPNRHSGGARPRGPRRVPRGSRRFRDMVVTHLSTSAEAGAQRLLTSSPPLTGGGSASAAEVQSPTLSNPCGRVPSQRPARLGKAVPPLSVSLPHWSCGPIFTGSLEERSQ